MFDYETLKIIWWVLVGVLLICLALTDGFDMGAMALMPFVGKTDNERRVAINTIAPHWDGNQVWLITAGGALFAAWPMVYAAAFSGMYWALLLVLFGLFFRPVGFDYRSKIENTTWRSMWDWALFVGGALPALLFGVAFGNLFLGLPFRLDNTLRMTYEGSFFGLLHPFALLAGVVSLSMLCAHGGTWLMVRTEGALYERARQAARLASIVFLGSFILAGLWLILGVDGMNLVNNFDPNGVLSPLAKQVTVDNGGWQANYGRYPLTNLAPLMALAGGVLTVLSVQRNRVNMAFLGSSLVIIGTICTAGFALFPFVFPSSIDPVSSLTMWDAVSSEHTLAVMTVVAVIWVPIILIYTIWCYAKMWGKLTDKTIEDNSHGLY